MKSLERMDITSGPSSGASSFPAPGGLMDSGHRDGGTPQTGGLQRPSDPPHPARILVSSNRKSVSYINLAKRFLQEHGEVQLSALGIAISSMVTVAEILKNKQLAEESRITTSLEWLSAESRVRHKPKMTVVLTKSARFDETIMAEGAHGSYANDDEDTYEDADYSDAAFQDPRVPDVGEGDINQMPDEAMARAPLGPAPSEVLHPSTRFLNDDGTRGGGVPTGRGDAPGGGRPVGSGMPSLGHMGSGRGTGGMSGYGQMYSDAGLAAMYSQAQHQQRTSPSALLQQTPQQQQQQQMLGQPIDARSGYAGDMRSGYGGSSFSPSAGSQHAFDPQPPPPPPRQQEQQHWQNQPEPPPPAGLPLHGGHSAFQQPQQQSIASPSPQSPETSSQSGSHTYHFGQMQGALADAVGGLVPSTALGDASNVPTADSCAQPQTETFANDRLARHDDIECAPP